MPDLLLEIGFEEMPAGFIPPALSALSALASRALGDNHLSFDSLSTVGTPRRMALVVRGVADCQEQVTVEVMGPARKVAFSEDGSLTKAGEGFARSQGVEGGDLEVKETPKGEYVFARRETGGKPALEILPGLLPALIGAIPFPKTMRWGEGSQRFARPLHWILALFGGEIVSFEFAGIASGNVSRGHRYLSPGTFTVTDPENYFRRARSASVIVDHEQRRGMIAEALSKKAEEAGGQVREDAELLETVTFLVEYPVVTCGTFAEEYLKLPPEVLITSMKSHQKYFPVVDETGALMPRFLTVNNIKARDMDVIRRGNERVLAARLADAQFFYREDVKIPLGERVDDLKKVVYQEKLGTSYDKMIRFRALSRHLSETCGLGDPGVADRAALLCKADLVTQMVGEFPELQGVMGHYYALEAGEVPEVAQAIREHYLPRFAGDQLPGSPAGMAVGLADKMDTIVGSFGIGQKPTGSEDPYGLRRQTLGIVNIIMERGLEVDLEDLVDAAVKQLEGKLERPAGEVKEDVLEFFRGRLENLFAQQGYRHDLVDAVLAPGVWNLVELRLKLEAVSEFCRGEEFEPLAVTFKRVGNIVPAGFRGTVDTALLREDAEWDLYDLFLNREAGISLLAKVRKYEDILRVLASIRPAVDLFFKDVMVMADDEALRKNRLALMSCIAALFARVADFTRVAV